MHEPPRDIPFWPDWLHDRLGPEHARTWCIASRLTERLRERGYTLAITPKRDKELQAEHAAEVREAVRRRLSRVAWDAYCGADHGRNPDMFNIVDAILADPAVAILVDHHDRRQAR